MDEKTNSETNKVNESPSVYAGKQIRIFNSFEEEEEFTRNERSKMTPEERLASVTDMLIRLYNDELNKPVPYNKLIVDY